MLDPHSNEEDLEMEARKLDPEHEEGATIVQLKLVEQDNGPPQKQSSRRQRRPIMAGAILMLGIGMLTSGGRLAYRKLIFPRLDYNSSCTNGERMDFELQWKRFQ